MPEPQWKKVERPELVKFEREGDSISGKLMQIREGNTKFGVNQFADIEGADGVIRTILLSEGMKIYNLNNYLGKMIMLEFVGETANERTGNTFKEFDFYTA